jgi:hypothetical protein
MNLIQKAKRLKLINSLQESTHQAPNLLKNKII